MSRSQLSTWLTPLIAVLGTGLSLAAGLWLEREQSAAARAEFERLSERIRHEVERQLTQPLYGLNGLRGLHVASDSVDRREFREWVLSRDMGTEFPGVRGFGRIEAVDAAARAAWLATVRADGAPDFRIRELSPGPFERQYVIRYSEPVERNGPAVGLDVGSEPRRRAAIERAIDTGEVMLTEPIVLVQDGLQTPGFLLYAPMYRPGPPMASAAERRQRLLGVAYAPIVARELLERVSRSVEGRIDYELHATVAGREELVYDSDGHLMTVGDVGNPYSGRHFYAERALAVHGLTLRVRTSSLPAFEAPFESGAHWLVMAAGLLGTAALCWVSSTGTRARQRAERLATSMTADLRRLAAVARHTSNAVVITGVDRRIVWVNEGFERVTGHTRDEALGQSPGQLLQCPGTDPAEVARLRAALDAGQAFTGELLNRSKDGREYWIALEIQPMRDEAGRLSGFMAVESDITERKTMLAQLQAARVAADRLAIVVRSTSNVVIITDRDKRIEWVNGAFEALYGHSLAQAAGRRPAELIGSLASAAEALATLRRAAEAGEGCRVELVNRRADGREVWVDVEVQPRRGIDGEVDGFVEIQVDITERRQAEQRLAALMRENAALLGTIREHAIVSVADADGLIVDANDAFCEISGYSRQELVGQNHRLINSGTHPAAFWSRMWATIRSGKTWRGQVCNRAKDGSLYWVDSIIAPFVDAQGRIEKYVSIRHDITGLKRATQQIAAQRQRLESIVNGTQAGTWEHRIDTGEDVINDLYAAMLGYTPDEFWAANGHDWTAPVHPDDREELMRQRAQHLHGLSTEFVAEFRMRHKAGHWVWVQGRGRVSQRNERGEPLAIAGIHLDISERKHAERELSRGRERLQQIIEGTNVGTWEWNVETGETVFNERWAQICGYTLAELGRTTIDTWSGMAHPADLSRSSALLERHFNGEIPAYECEARMRHKDGHWVWVLDRGKLFSRSADGRPRWMAGTHMDITERKQAEAALRDSQAFLDRTGRIGGVGGWSLDLDTQELRWTDQTARIHGLEPGQQPRLDDALSYYAPEARPVIQAAVERCIAHGEGYDLELPFVTAGGRPIWVRTIGEAEREGDRPDGRVCRLVGSFQDVTARRELTAALERQNQLLDSVVDHLPCGLVAFDGERRLMLANRELTRLLDLPEELLRRPGASFEEVVRYQALRGEYGPYGEAGSPTLQGLIDERIARVADGVVAHQFERERPDGTMLEVRGAPLPGGGWVATYSDITARRRAEAEARRAGRLLGDAIEAIDEAFVLFDPDDRLVMCNERYRRVYAHSADLIRVGARFEDILRGGAQRGQYAEAEGREEAWVAERMASHRAGNTRRIQRLKDGRTLRIVERRLDDGHIVGFRVDVTELEQAREQAEHARQTASEALARLQAIYDILPVGITITDPEGHIVDCNPASERLLGISKAEHLARRYDSRDWQILREDGTPMPAEEFASVRALAGRRPVHDAVMQVVTPQRRVWLSVSAMPADHPELGVVVGYVDISEQRAQQAALLEAKAAAEQASLAKSQFLANMSHEIRTPMNAILGMLTLLRRTELSARQADYAAKTEGAARSLLGLLNDILDFSKVEAGKMTLDLHPFRLDQLMRDLAVILSASVGAKPLEVLFDLEPGLPQALVGDALRLQQVLINLAGNAIKFTAQGEVVVSVRRVGGEARATALRFEVRDTGIGIAPEHQARIFQGFSQAEASTTRRFGGTGLGLAISQRLVALMGGRLELDSAPGRGSRFAFTVTLAVADGQPAAAPTLPAATKPLRALVVDDNATARDVLRRQCESLHWHTEQAADAVEALARVAQAQRDGRPYDVLLVDWMMPGVDGFQALAQLREQGLRDAATAVVMVSAHGREQLEAMPGEERGLIDAFLVKPVTPSMLLDAVMDVRASGGAPLPVRAAPATGTRRLEGLRLLLAEDNANNRQVACELLGDEGATVEVAHNGAEAVEAVAAADPPYDLVLMDLQMPVMDGYTATGRIRQDLRNAVLPIVAMTANAMASDRDACLAAGMNDHVGKPFDLDRLVQVIRRLCGHAVPAAGAAAPPPAGALPATVAQRAAEAGIELEAALRRMGGKAPVLRRLLDDFLRDADDLVAQAQAALTAGRAADAGRALHTLKGLAATLGIGALAARAAEGERLVAQAPTPPAADAPAGSARAAVQAVVDELARARATVPGLLSAWAEGSAAPPPAAPPDALDPGALREDLRRLAVLLSDSDMAALEALQALGERHPAAAGPQMQALEAATHALDFETARAAAESWMGELGA